ncbi:hypothetical protein ACQPUZ_12750 [Clostridium tertium]
MDDRIKNKLVAEAKNNMPELWGKIEVNLENKKNKYNKNLIAIAAIIAVVIITGTIGTRFIYNHSNDSEGVNYLGIAENIKTLPDLNLDDYLADKVLVGGKSEANQANDKRFIEYNIEADNVIYGKVTEVNSYVDFGLFICSDVKIEVIKDFKGSISKGESVIVGDSGGELTYDEFISGAYDNLADKRGYDNILDKSKILVEMTKYGIPQYRTGEYVLVYIEEADKDSSYSQTKDGIKTPITYDYFPLKKLYVDPNTEDVFEYLIDSKNNKLIKQNLNTLNDIKNFYN